MGKQLFGTDGIRGVAGEFPLDRAGVHAFGRALGSTLKTGVVAIGCDTRESSRWIAAEVAGGLAAEGVSARFAGVTTTPGVAFLARGEDFAGGVMISASHNPYRDNGLKVFGHNGYKLPDDEEHAIEEKIFALLDRGLIPSAMELPVDDGLDRAYLRDLLSTLKTRLDGLKLVVDCGNGAASHLAPELLRGAGARVIAIHHTPDGRNINEGCGALHPEGMAARVIAERADAGVAFDGDADRAIFATPSGRVIDGDGVLLLCARALNEPVVIATVMSNLGLEKALVADGRSLVRTPVGDKYVLDEMIRRGAMLGGEQSGHVIFRSHSTTGDGMLTALRVFEQIAQSGKSLDVLTRDLTIYPQRLVNVRVRERRNLEDMPSVAGEIAACERALNGSGRILVRFSGTEPLARVMVEAASEAEVVEFSTRIAAAIERELG